jgi:hypothetical protein
MVGKCCNRPIFIQKNEKVPDANEGTFASFSEEPV